MLRSFYLAAGFTSLGLGGLGILLPLLPTVPFVILAAFCFARSNPALENWLLAHPRFGASIRLWRDRGAISPYGKRAAVIAFAVSSATSAMLVPLPWSLISVLACAVGGVWVWTRPDC